MELQVMAGAYEVIKYTFLSELLAELGTLRDEGIINTRGIKKPDEIWAGEMNDLEKRLWTILCHYETKLEKLEKERGKIEQEIELLKQEARESEKLFVYVYTDDKQKALERITKDIKIAKREAGLVNDLLQLSLCARGYPEEEEYTIRSDFEIVRPPKY